MSAGSQGTADQGRALQSEVGRSSDQLESVESGISTFEEEFLPFIVLPNDATVAGVILPMIDGAYKTGKMPPQLLLGDGSEGR